MNFFTTYFDSTHVSLLFATAFFLVLSLFFQIRKKASLSLFFLVFTAIGVFSFSALLDPFINLWDERFHALVAKNLMNHPLMPTLYDNPVVNMQYDSWDKQHIWLHKQPLFLWQIALSFKLFGISEFTLRLPNIVLGVILVVISYRSGKLLVNQRVGYLSGILVISTSYLLELIAGRQEIEHNDISFLVYVSLSLWSLIEYHYSGKKYWIPLIGLFSGMAILCKWLVGLLVYFGWAVLKFQQKKFMLSDHKDIFISFFVTVLIAAPWQILTFMWYPAEAAYEHEYNTLHFLIPIEGHGGDFWYHFDMFNTIYGAVASFLIIPAIIVFLKKCKDRELALSLLSMIVVVYLFFTIAATKMPSFTIIVSMLVFIAYASLFDGVLRYFGHFIKVVRIKQVIVVLSVVALVFLRFDVEYFQKKYTLWEESNVHTRMFSHNKEVFEGLNLPPNTVLFNVKGNHYIEAMFYTSLPAYGFVPTIEQYQDIKRKGYNAAVFTTDKNELPFYLTNDTTVVIIKKEIMGY